jgi:hypothetical protein
MANKVPNLSAAEREALKQELLEEIRLEKEAQIAKEEALRLAAEAQARKDYLLQEQAKKDALEAIKAGEEPWVNITGIVRDPDRGIKIELDWNDTFIKYLKENGIEGPSDDIIVQRWLELISAQVSTDLAIMDAEKSITDGSEFE